MPDPKSSENETPPAPEPPKSVLAVNTPPPPAPPKPKPAPPKPAAAPEKKTEPPTLKKLAGEDADEFFGFGR